MASSRPNLRRARFDTTLFVTAVGESPKSRRAPRATTCRMKCSRPRGRRSPGPASSPLSSPVYKPTTRTGPTQRY